jgi:hypothetical protein
MGFHADEITSNSKYQVGLDFCLERPQPGSDIIQVELQCDTLNSNGKTNYFISPAVPRPSIAWFFNGEKVLDGENFDEKFLIKGRNYVFTPGFVSPPTLTPDKNRHGFSIYFDFQVSNFSLLAAVDPDITDHLSLQGLLFSHILGSWTCVQSNVYGSTNATTRITDCGKCTVYPCNPPLF